MTLTVLVYLDALIKPFTIEGGFTKQKLNFLLIASLLVFVTGSRKATGDCVHINKFQPVPLLWPRCTTYMVDLVHRKQAVRLPHDIFPV